MGKPQLRKDPASLMAVGRLRKNPKFAEMGLTDEKLGKIEGIGFTNLKVSYAEMVEDLDELGKFLSQNPTTRLENFAARIDELASGKMEDRQGTLGVIKEILEHTDDYKGKTLSFEKSVKNSDGESAFIDIYTSDIPPQLVERKWISSSTPVSEKTFIREFIKRDLFTATDLSQIVWSIKGNKLTKAKVVEYLKSTEGREVLPKSRK